MAVTGVFNSWLALATNSRRVVLQLLHLGDVIYTVFPESAYRAIEVFAPDVHNE